MSSSSTRSSRNNRQLMRIGRARNATPTPCDCPKPYRSKERIPWTDENPGRRFYNCPYSLSTRITPCDFFDWKDGPLLDPHYKALLIRMKNDIERRDTASGIVALRSKIEDLETQIFVLDSHITENKENHMLEVMKLKTEAEMGKGKMKMAEMVILILVVLVIVLVVLLIK